MQEKSQTLFYECPHCHESLEINEAMMDQKVDCPKCAHPFFADPPRAQPTARPSRSESEAFEKQRADDTHEHERDLPPDPRGDIFSPSNDEEVIRVIHPTLFRRHIFGTMLCALLALGGIALIFMGLAGMPLLEFVGLPLIITGAVPLLIGGFFILKWFITSRVTSLTLTSERIIYTYGLFHRSTNEMRHDDVLNMKMEQNFLERILHFGDMALSSAGDNGMEIAIHDVPRPQEMAEFIRQRQ
jgi:DNA-directed RNA polymerase subunit RPC12/RpoP